MQASHQLGSYGRLASTIGITLLVLLACGPAEKASSPSNEAPSPATIATKVVRFAVQTEFAYLVQYGHVPTANPGPERFYVFHSNLTVFDAEGNPQPLMAQKVPTIQDGDWKLNPDGTMEVTWKIRPGVLWQDGTPLTAQDFAFGFEVLVDPRLVVDGGTENLKDVSGVRATDAQTLVVSWRAPWIYANSNHHEGIPALKRDQIEPLYRSLDPVAFADSQVWRSEFVGLGPYRATEWVLGDHITAVAFDRFFLGRPKIDRVEYHWVAVTQLAAQTLAGSIDSFGVGAFGKGNQLAEIQQQKGPSWGTWFLDRVLARGLNLNHREGGAWAQDVRFRQAMAYSLNRPAMAEAVAGPHGERTDYVLDQSSPVYKLAEQRGVPKYSFDPTRAAQLFAEAGWAKGADGLLRNRAGQTVDFPCCRYPDADAENTRESLIWGDALKQAGIDAHHPIPAAPAGLTGTDLRKARNFGWAGMTTHIYLTPRQHFLTLSSAVIPDDANRWTGTNNGAYSNPAYDKLLAERLTTLPITERREKEVQLVKILAEEVPFLVVYYLGNPIVARDGITGVSRQAVLNDAYTVNIHQWDMK
ncbi:MAG: hypothetical protein EXR58_07220 [Chloroflexi bacterium]|nr:hypothetical protein [Chloroflexota bacterium]